MRSATRGSTTSKVEVNNIDRFGIWILLQGREYFLPYDEYPWFRDARLSDVLNVALVHDDHLHWPALDVDLCVESLEHPEDFPLVYKPRIAAPPRRRTRRS